MGWQDHFRKQRTNVVSSILEFKAIDTDGMIRSMRLRELARERGEKNLPSQDSEGFDSVEQSIITNTLIIKGPMPIERRVHL